MVPTEQPEDLSQIKAEDFQTNFKIRLINLKEPDIETL
jgi:hypothetical protein